MDTINSRPQSPKPLPHRPPVHRPAYNIRTARPSLGSNQTSPTTPKTDLKPHQSLPPRHTPQQPQQPAPRTLEIEFKFPALPKLPLRSLGKKLRVLIGSRLVRIAALLVLISAAVLFAYNQISKSTTSSSISTAGGSTYTAQKLEQGTPTYKTILPSGKNIDQLGGWTRVSPPDRDPVFAYVDHVGSVQINVSQQPLPKEFKEDTDAQIQELAKGYRADQKLTAGSTVIYLGTSAKGPQSAIFAKDGLLVLIKSAVKIDNNQWVDYINSLH